MTQDDIPPQHPGRALTQAIAETRLSRAQVAEFVGISRKHLYDLMDEKKAISPRIAVRLGKFFGNDARSWIDMQSAFDLWHAIREVDTSQIPTFKVRNTP
jgi:addiction module HigA family antidote